MGKFVTDETEIAPGAFEIKPFPAYSSNFSCPVTVAVGDAVYLSAADAVDKASAADNTKVAVGIVIAKPSTTTATVKWAGEAASFVGLTPGATYYLAIVAGAITDIAPILPGNIVQPVGFARNATTLVVQINRNYTVLVV